MTVMEWEKTMIKPEMKVIKWIKWKHINELMESIDQPIACQKEEVAMVFIIDPETNNTLELRTMCPSCLRSLTIYGNTNNKN